jgi:YgiT-type zinc finger domain-containing protein
MKCHNCKGNMVPTKKQVVIKNGAIEITVDKIQAFVCEDCQQIQYNGKDIEMIADIRSILDQRQLRSDDSETVCKRYRDES